MQVDGQAPRAAQLRTQEEDAVDNEHGAARNRQVLPAQFRITPVVAGGDPYRGRTGQERLDKLRLQGLEVEGVTVVALG